MNKRHSGSNILIIIGVLCIAAAIGLSGYNILTSHKAGEASHMVIEKLDLSDALTPAWYSDKEMPVTSVDGVDYIGMLTIPDLNLQLPVAADWSYEQLLSSPCCYTGNYYKNDMVVCAHNYPTHFG